MAERYAVVSCHVERPLDDGVWNEFARVQEQRPGGFRIAALMRPPDAAAGERDQPWLDRARAAAVRGPLGHHTHFGGAETARPADRAQAVARFRAEVAWLRERGLAPRFFCGGGWYLDRELAAALAEEGYVDCSAVAFELTWLGADEPVLRLSEPTWLRLDGGLRLLELPTTHSLGSLARGLARLPERLVHVHFHDWELVERRRRAALAALLFVLARLARPLDLDELAAAAASAPEREY